MPLAQGTIGPVFGQDGALLPSGVRQGKLGDVIVSELHGRFYEQAYRGNLFSGGMSLTAINNATYTTATLGATVTPIIGVYNPIGSPVNLVLLQATLALTVTAATATGGGPFAWATGLNTASTLTAGNAPLNRKTLIASGANAKDLTNVAPTNLSPNLVVRFGSALMGGLIKNISSVETAVGQNIGMSGISVENFDGSFIVPPGGVVALLATTTPAAHSAVSSLLWEEVPL